MNFLYLCYSSYSSIHEFIMTQLNDRLLVGLLALLMVERSTDIEDWV